MSLNSLGQPCRATDSKQVRRTGRVETWWGHMLEAIFDTGISASVNGKVYKTVVRLAMMFGTDKKTGSGEQGSQNHQPDVPGLAILRALPS